ncbi:porin [Formosimonas limnophila]|nr:porin [Formosimonas limnophila]
MKKSLVALAVLGSFAGAASAANSVTLYGRVDVGYQKFSHEFDNDGFNQSGNGETRLGIKGEEDLGNGLAATFQLEGRFDGDTGSKTEKDDGSQLAFFDRESTVGLKGSFGHVRFGRSVAAMDKALDRYVVGERVATLWDPYASSTRHSNTMFYDFASGGFDGGFHVSTKGGAVGDTTEGKDGEKIGYGVFAGYTVAGFTVSAAYQADKAQFARPNLTQNISAIGEFAADKEWGVGMSYQYNPVKFSVTYAEAKSRQQNSSYKAKLKTWTTALSADVTANDNVYVKYMEKRFSDNYSASLQKEKGRYFGLGYSHALSKRTSVYADVGRYDVKQTVGRATYKNDGTAFDIALRHNF